MVRKSTVALGLLGGLLVGIGVRQYGQRRSTPTVQYTVVAHLDDVELRRYPSVVAVESVADSEEAAFWRLFRYISGANEGETGIEMTAPVEVRGGSRIPMAVPVESETTDEQGVRMTFYLPSAYDRESAPTPTDSAVALRAVPERTLAVRRFSWRPTGARVARETEHLLRTLDRAAVPTAGDPVFMAYDPPWTLPPLRRNEVAVEVEAEADGDASGTSSASVFARRPSW